MFPNVLQQAELCAENMAPRCAPPEHLHQGPEEAEEEESLHQDRQAMEGTTVHVEE